MSLLKKLQSKFFVDKTFTSFSWLLMLFLVVHVFLFNINTAEWGDSYRILRAAEYIKSGEYPEDEKRPPLLSLILALRPSSIDAVTFGRIILFIVSTFSFVIFYKLAQQFDLSQTWLNWVSVAFILNNVYLYWSLRIMADVPFSFFVLLIFYLLRIRYHQKKLINLFVVGVITGLSILMRFEGYLLAMSVGLYLIFPEIKFELKKIVNRALKSLPFVAGILIIILPYIIYKNPFGSSYFEEPSSRAYDLKMFLIYVISLISLTGVPVLFYLIITNYKALYSKFKTETYFLFFVFLELVLILLWPAAVPRLFVSIIPLLLIMYAFVIEKHFSDKNLKITNIILPAIILVVYVAGQYFLKQQFLILDKGLFIVNLLLQILVIYSLYKHKTLIFVYTTIVCMLLWSYLIITMHKDIFISVKNAAHYATHNYKGRIGYNDVSSVSDWYLNHSTKSKNVEGFYYNTEKKANLEREKLIEANIDYLLITNEHNTTMTLDLNKRPYLKELRVFEYNVNGKNFVARLVEVI